MFLFPGNHAFIAKKRRPDTHAERFAIAKGEYADEGERVKNVERNTKGEGGKIGMAGKGARRGSWDGR